MLDRAVEFLPDDMQLSERRRRSQPFTRPELSVLLAYAKLTLYDDLLESAVPDDPYLARELVRYFPKAIAARFPDALEHHRLRREIIATHLANSMINRGGPSLIVRIADQTGAAPASIAAAFAAVRDSYEHDRAEHRDRRPRQQSSGKLQLDLYAAVQDLLLDRIVWFLRNVDLTKGLADIVAHYRDGIAAVTAALDSALSPDIGNARAARGAGTRRGRRARRSLPAASPIFARSPPRPTSCWSPTAPASRSARSPPPISPPARSSASTASPAPPSTIPIADYFDRLALDRARDSIGDAERRLDRRHGRQRRGRRRRAVEAWVAPRKSEVERIRIGDPRDRQFRADAVEAFRRRKPARRSGEDTESGGSSRRSTKKNPKQLRAWGS